MQKVTTILTAGFLLILAIAVLTNLPRRSPHPAPPPEGFHRGTPPPHFQDHNRDGFNDLAPDHDRDGIPDPLDPDAREHPGFDRWARYRAIPDSVRADSLLFTDWMRKHHPRANPARAWEHWQRLQQNTPPCFWDPNCPTQRSLHRMREQHSKQTQQRENRPGPHHRR